MNKYIKDIKKEIKCQRGFSILEISIVLIVIGILAAGILKSTHLIDDAKINMIIKQINDYRMATTIFSEKFNSLPGDLKDATTQIGVDLIETDNGDGSGILLGKPFEDAKGSQRFWKQLRGAGLVKYSGTFPTTKFGGLVGVQYVSETKRQGHWLVFGKKKNPQGEAGPLLTPKHAAYINKTLDDGKPKSGSIQSSAEGCLSGDNYDLTNDKKVCMLYVSID